MISTNSLAAFAHEVGRPAATSPVRALGSVQGGGSQTRDGSGNGGLGINRTLEAVPPAPSRPLPRGSLLDLKV